jgi:hypothetical protein
MAGLVACGCSGCTPSSRLPAVDQNPVELAERVAPYVDMTLPGGPDLAQAVRTTGVRLFNLAFVTVGRDCEPAWGGIVPIHDPDITDRIRRVRAAGGDVRVSFGGERHAELAERCGSVGDLVRAYGAVLDAYDGTRADFDVEGGALEDRAGVRRRNEAIRRLQAAMHLHGRRLRVSYTLPAHSLGLTDESRALLRDAHARGVVVEAVNVMTMNYGTGVTDMAARSKAVAESTKSFIQELWPGTSDERAWRMVAVTPMIGVNDTAPETFRPQDAEALVTFAHRKGLGGLSFWSMNRDRPCRGDVARTRASSSCSGVHQRPGDFMKIFAEYIRPAVAPVQPLQ